MNWNFRVVQDKHGDFSIREVFYDDEGNVDLWAIYEMAPIGETLSALKADFEKMKEAFRQPALKEVEDKDGVDRLEEI